MPHIDYKILSKTLVPNAHVHVLFDVKNHVLQTSKIFVDYS